MIRMRPLRADWLPPLLLIAFVLAALLAPAFSTTDPNAVDLRRSLRPPGDEAVLGTDQLGRDVFARIAHGGRTALLTGVVVVVLSTGLALCVGGGAGYLGGKVDATVAATLDALLTLPGLLVTLAILGILGTGRLTLIVALVGASWATEARVLRSVTLAIRRGRFVEAARASGAGDLRILLRHVLPNTWSATLVLASLSLGEVLLVVSGLSFLGIGAQPPDADWGTMLADGRTVIAQAPWLMLAPGCCIVLYSVLANLAGDAMRDLTDPHRRGQ